MATYNVTISGGSGSAAMQAGTYNVSASAEGYTATTPSPSTYTATTSTGSGAFTLTATGTLTFNVNETGASGGTPVTGGTIVMTNQDGTIEYGTAQNISETGVAVFDNVPFGSSSSPITLYFKQLTTDSDHNIDPDIITVSMQSQTQVEYIQNTPIATQTFTLTDGTYTGLPISSATLTFTND